MFSGDFDTLENLGEEGHEGDFGDYFYGHANKLTISGPLLMILSCVLLLVGV